MTDSPSVVAYLTHEIRELLQLGPVHSFTWVSQADPGRWMQVSVHDGSEHYLTVLCVLPPHVSMQQVDKLLGKVGRKQAQVNHGTCVIYYLAKSESSTQLFEQASSAAQQCAAIAGLLWGASSVDDLELLGARGPKLPIRGGQRPSIVSGSRVSPDAVPEAALPPPLLSARSVLPEAGSGDGIETVGP